MPLRPNRLRHFINFHNPAAMGYEFDEIGNGPGEEQELSVLTNKLVRDLRGDVVWMVSRRTNRPTYYLYGKFRVSRQNSHVEREYKYEIEGTGTILPKPIPLGCRLWFEKLLTINPNLSQGFQSILDREIIIGLQKAFDEAKGKAAGA